MAISITQPRLLICEGPSDVAFFKHLIQARNLPPYDVFHPKQLDGVAAGNTGFEEFLRGISVLLPSSAVSGILVVSDNDTDPVKSFQNVRAQIVAAGNFGVPDAPLEIARSAGYPPLVVMMLPRSGVPGVLETLCIEGVYSAKAGFKDCIDQYCVCTKTDLWNEAKQPKMRLEALMAAICESDPATALQYAWSRKESIIPLDRPVFDEISAFLTNFAP